MGKQKMKVSAVIPVFNEERTVVNVASILIGHPQIDEVICVDDASTDKSLQVLKNFGRKITIITLDKNKGKGHALSKGVKIASGDIILFLDSDLSNLTNDHISALINPLLQKKAKAVFGHTMQREKQIMATNPISMRITGQRAYFRNDLLSHLKEMSKTKYGIEIYLNSIHDSKEVIRVPLMGVNHVWKHKKYKRGTAVKKYIEQVIDIAEEIGKQEGLLPRDYDAIAGFRKIKDTKEIIQRINYVQSKRVKITLQRAFAEIFYD